MSNIKQKHYAELLRDDFTTVLVQLFSGRASFYTYKVLKSQVEAWKLRRGSLVLVPAPVRLSKAAPASPPYENQPEHESVNFFEGKTGVVYEVHDDPQIDFDSDIDYKWLVQAVDLTVYTVNTSEDQTIKNTAIEIQKKRSREVMRAQFLGQSPLPEALSLDRVR